jgi:hypothetical protein
MTQPSVNAITSHGRCGFRFSAVDAGVIAVGAAATWMLRDALREMALLPGVVLLHFFLFCNVFRVRRSYELVWAATFIVNLLAWQIAGAMSWGRVLAVQLPITLLAIAAEMRSRRYHGVAWRWINPSCCSGNAVSEGPL